MQGTQPYKQISARSAPNVRYSGQNIVQHLVRFALCRAHSSEPRASIHPRSASNKSSFEELFDPPGLTFSLAGICTPLSASHHSRQALPSAHVRVPDCHRLILLSRKFPPRTEEHRSSVPVQRTPFLLSYSMKQPKDSVIQLPRLAQVAESLWDHTKGR